MVFLNGKYNALDDHALTVGDHLTAAINTDGRLLFRSYRDASQLLDMSAFFSEATEADIRGLLKTSPIVSATDADIDKVVEISDSSMRVRFSILRHEGTLNNEKANAKSIRDSALEYGIAIELTGKLPHFKFRFPTKKETLKLFLKFLSHSYYESLITGEKYVSNSHRKV